MKRSIRQQLIKNDMSIDDYKPRASRCPFEPGDRVQRIGHPDYQDIVRCVPGMEEYDKQGFINADRGFWLKLHGWESQENWKKVKEDRNNFKVGDVVVGNEHANHYYSTTTQGTRWFVTGISHGEGWIEVDHSLGSSNPYVVRSECFDLVSRRDSEDENVTLTTEAKSPEQNVNILNAFQKLFMDVDAQTLRKAGYIHEDSSLTDEGHDALDAILVKNNKAELVAAAQAKLDEIEKSKK